MAAGRPAKPLELKVIQGTAREDRINKQAPQYEVIKRVPAVPPALKKNKKAAAHWRRLASQLINHKLLNHVNIDLLEVYVVETYIYHKAMDSVEKNGILIMDTKGELKTNPARRIASDAMKNMMQVAREFGITPSTSQKIIVHTDDPTTGRKRKIEFDL